MAAFRRAAGMSEAGAAGSGDAPHAGAWFDQGIDLLPGLALSHGAIAVAVAILLVMAACAAAWPRRRAERSADDGNAIGIGLLDGDGGDGGDGGGD